MFVKRTNVTALAFALTLLPSQVLPGSEPESEDNERWQYAARQLAEDGVASDVESLVVALSTHPDTMVRIRAAFILGERGDKEAIPILRQALEEPSTRRAAAGALARLGEEEGLEILRDLMASSADLGSQLAIAYTLARLGSFEGYSYLVDGAMAEEYWNRIDAASILPEFFAMPEPFSMESPMELLEQLLRDPNSLVRKEAVRSFGLVAVKGGPAEELLEKAQEMEVYDPDEGVREAAGLVQYPLRKILKKEASSEAAKEEQER